jgi:4-amino-4-deoxy-L-arabinose transferase-like glycosyltransferase
VIRLPSRASLLCLLLAYWAISLHNLTVVPPVYEDEPWQASTGWKLAEEGVFGSDLFTGFYGMEHHYYGYMPIHPLLLAIVFKLGGLGLFQLRFEPVAMGLLILVLTYSLGRRLFGPAVGLLAVWGLLFVRLTGITTSQLSGILFLDIARIGRYDMVVPVFGLAALHVYIGAGRTNTEYGIGDKQYFLAGLLVGLAGLSHLYGLFWLPALMLPALWQRVGWRNLLALLLGFAVPWLFYLLYVVGGWQDWIGQTRDYAPRFGLLDWQWYVSNLLRERQRYGPGLGPPGWQYLLRPGLWVTMLLLPVAMLALAQRALRKSSPEATAARYIVVPGVLFPVLFALFIYLKLSNYLVLVAPIGAIAASWGAVSLWRHAGGRGWLQAVLGLLLMAVTAEGVARMVAVQTAAQTTPYDVFIAQVHDYVRPEERVLGLHHYWLEMEDTDYRSWVVPLLQKEVYYWSPPRPLPESLSALSPDVILIDRRMAELFAAQPETAEVIQAWMDQEGYKRVAVVDDVTYGRMEIYRIEEGTQGNSRKIANGDLQIMQILQAGRARQPGEKVRVNLEGLPRPPRPYPIVTRNYE